MCAYGLHVIVFMIELMKMGTCDANMRFERWVVWGSRRLIRIDASFVPLQKVMIRVSFGRKKNFYSKSSGC